MGRREELGWADWSIRGACGYLSPEIWRGEVGSEQNRETHDIRFSSGLATPHKPRTPRGRLNEVKQGLILVVTTPDTTSISMR